MDPTFSNKCRDYHSHPNGILSKLLIAYHSLNGTIMALFFLLQTRICMPRFPILHHPIGYSLQNTCKGHQVTDRWFIILQKTVTDDNLDHAGVIIGEEIGVSVNFAEGAGKRFGEFLRIDS